MNSATLAVLCGTLLAGLGAGAASSQQSAAEQRLAQAQPAPAPPADAAAEARKKKLKKRTGKPAQGKAVPGKPAPPKGKAAQPAQKPAGTNPATATPAKPFIKRRAAPSAKAPPPAVAQPAPAARIAPPAAPGAKPPRTGGRIGGKRPAPAAGVAAGAAAGAAAVPGAGLVAQPGPAAKGPSSIRGVKSRRTTTTELGGKRQITNEPGQRQIIRENNRVFIRHNDSARFQRSGADARTERLSSGGNQTIVNRPGGITVISVFDRRGNLIERRRRHRDGREVRLIDNRRWFGTGAKVALGVGIAALTVALVAPRMTIPRRDYIVDYHRASPDYLYTTLSAPPVDTFPRRYSLEEVRYSVDLRDRLRRVDLDAITFASGSWDITPSQRRELRNIADVMLRILDRNPDEMFLIEGHTDAVGLDIDNLTLSDRRAEAVAIILTDLFNVPPENLVTQGYGEQYLKIPTSGPERANRRVSIRRITPLLARN